MFKRKTLFIVGAGASAEFGLPVGTELAAAISGMLAVEMEEGRRKVRDRSLWRRLVLGDQENAPKYTAAFGLISEGVRLSNSIDDFLDVHRANEYANRSGKAAIVKAILAAERSSDRLYYDRSNAYNRMDISRAEGTWIIKFVRMLGRNVPLADIKKVFENVAFLVFNYDRCIEHFLLHALQHLYSINEQHAAEILNTLEIIHPYGDVGELKTPLQGNGTPFGGGDEDLESFNYAALANRIRTYTEVKDDEARENIDALVQDAETWIFLGFAFHEQNLRLIKSGGTRLAKAKRVYATALGMSDSDVNITRGRILDFFTTASQVPLKLHLDQSIHDFTCAKLFDYYTQSLPN